MIPKIFISHSCKDNEEQAPAGLHEAAVAGRAKRLAFARLLRDRLHARLVGDPRCKVFLDVRGGLKAGDVWQDGLHTALRSCAGGVVLLSPESIESGWVLKEATILSWRVFLGEHLILVPVVLGVADADLQTRGFGALDLERIQWVRLTDCSDESLARAVDLTIAALEPAMTHALAGDPVLTPTERWIHEFAHRLGEALPQAPTLKNDHLRRMCDALSIQPEERQRFDADPLVNLASHVLMAGEEQIIRFLNRAGKPTAAQREELKAAVAALWVDPAAASRLLFAAEKGRVVAIDATGTSRLREYILRAFCNDIDPHRIVEPSDVTEGTDEQVIAEIEESLSALLPVEEPDKLTKYVKDNGAVFVILGQGSARPSVLDGMTTRYPQLTFVVATGAKPRDRLGSWWDRVMLLQPLLQPRRETTALRFQNQLLAFVTGNARA